MPLQTQEKKLLAVLKPKYGWQRIADKHQPAALNLAGKSYLEYDSASGTIRVKLSQKGKKAVVATQKKSRKSNPRTKALKNSLLR